MKSIRNLFTAGFLAVLAIAAVAALCGYPIVPPEAFAGIGMVPIAIGEVTMSDLKKLIDQQGASWDEFVSRSQKKYEKLESDIIDVAKKNNRLSFNGTQPETEKPETWIDSKSGREIAVLSPQQSVAALSEKSEVPTTLGRYLRGIVLGGRAPDAKSLELERKALGGSSNPAGGFLVPDALSGEFIDLMRANQVLVQAGARTVPMETSTLTLARLTADPTISWHGENGSLTAAEPTFGAVTLSSKTVVCLVKISLELSQDAVNIDQILSSTLVNAMANAIDSAGLNGVTGTGAGAAPGGVIALADRNTVTGIGAPTSWDFVVDGMYELMADNVDMTRIGAMVAHPAVWKKMRKLKTGIASDNTPLMAPDEVVKLRKLWTTAAPLSGGTTATGVIADWRDLLYGVRKDISIQVLNQTFMGSNLQLGILAYARVDFAATRPQSFCTLEGITV